MNLKKWTGSKITKNCRTNMRRSRHVKFECTSIRALDLVATSSPSLQARKRRPVAEAVNPRKTPILADEICHAKACRTRGPISSTHVIRSDATSRFECGHGAGVPSPHPRPSRMSYKGAAHLQDAQATREHSNSKRNEWLKRRRNVDPITGGSQELQQAWQYSSPRVDDGSAEQTFDRHNARWHSQNQNQGRNMTNLQKLRLKQRGKVDRDLKTMIDDFALDTHSRVSQSNHKAEFSEKHNIILDSSNTNELYRPHHPPKKSTHKARGLSSNGTHQPLLSAPSLPLKLPIRSTSIEIQDSQEQRKQASTVAQRETIMSTEGMTFTHGLDQPKS